MKYHLCEDSELKIAKQYNIYNAKKRSFLLLNPKGSLLQVPHKTYNAKKRSFLLLNSKSSFCNIENRIGDKLIDAKSSSSPRSISIGQLNTLPHLHLRPIKLVVYK